MNTIDYLKKGKIAYALQVLKDEKLKIFCFSKESFNPYEFEFRDEKFLGAGMVARGSDNSIYFWNEFGKDFKLNVNYLKEYFSKKENIRLELR
jgi:hypothetical protein